MTYEKKCPDVNCDKMITYKSASALWNSKNKNSKCRGCVNKERKSILESHRDLIAILYADGLSPNAIAKEINADRETVVKFIENSLGLTTKKNSWARVKWIDDERIECSRCGQIKDQSKFPRRFEKPLSKCKGCVSEIERNRYLSAPWKWEEKVRQIKSSSARRGIECSVTTEYLKYLWDVQDGRCVYTQEKLELGIKRGNSPMSISIDRINPSEGYSNKNVVICSNRANTIKHDMTEKEFQGWMPLWYSRLKVLQEEISNGRPEQNSS